mgnify:CR=1 FL=1
MTTRTNTRTNTKMTAEKPANSGESKEENHETWLQQQYPKLGLNLYYFKGEHQGEISGAGCIYAKKQSDGPPLVLTALEDRTPIHQGPLKDPGKALEFDNINLEEAYGTAKLQEAERLFGLLNRYRYRRVGLREAAKDLNEARCLDKLLNEELQQCLKHSEVERRADFYLGRAKVDRMGEVIRHPKTGNPVVSSWQPWFIVFDDETRALCEGKRKRTDIFSAKSFKFDQLPDGIQLAPEFWEKDGDKYALNNPYQEVAIDLDDAGNVADSHFQTQNAAKQYLLDYIADVHAAKISGKPDVLGEGRKGKVETYADFGLGRWGEEGLLTYWSQIMALVIAK